MLFISLIVAVCYGNGYMYTSVQTYIPTTAQFNFPRLTALHWKFKHMQNVNEGKGFGLQTYEIK